MEQGDLSLAEYIDKATILCNQCEHPPEARDRLLRDTIVIGLCSQEAYFKYIEKGSALTLEEAITIGQNEDATVSQVGYVRPEFKGGLTQAALHQLHEKQGARPKRKKQQKERGGSDNPKRTKRDTCFNCGAKPAHPRSQCPSKNLKCFKCKTEGHYGSVCKSKSKGGNVDELQTQPINAPLNEDCTAEDYTPV